MDVGEEDDIYGTREERLDYSLIYMKYGKYYALKGSKIFKVLS
jgi:hypothetical protein